MITLCTCLGKQNYIYSCPTGREGLGRDCGWKQGLMQGPGQNVLQLSSSSCRLLLQLVLTVSWVDSGFVILLAG